MLAGKLAKRQRIGLREHMNLLNVASRDDSPAIRPISPEREMGAYEALWLEDKASFKTIADRFKADPAALPSDFVEPSRIVSAMEEAKALLRKRGVIRFGVRVNHAGDYPPKLRDARHPVELLYYQGAWELTETRSIAIVGSRKASDEGIARAKRIAKDAVNRDFTVVSGLAEGIDTAAHTQALAEPGGRTIAVIGTPLGEFYPKQNRLLQCRIARDFLVVSQVPIIRYSRQGPAVNRLFFPERNATMSALTEGTVIVEAGETSGTLTQARASLHQGRKLFILDSCFHRTDLTWPRRFADLGAIRVRDSDDIWSALG
jgi:DNA processing protein